MSEIDDELIAAARAAMERAYAPYSGFRVGAALEADDGRVFVGCNVENSSYPVGICAERVAIGRAVSEGATSFRRVAVASTGTRAASPCGMCRQALSEFAPDLEVISAPERGEPKSWRLSELLPHAFRLAGSAGGGDPE